MGDRKAAPTKASPANRIGGRREGNAAARDSAPNPMVTFLIVLRIERTIASTTTAMAPTSGSRSARGCLGAAYCPAPYDD
jgi:hypothetical protein